MRRCGTCWATLADDVDVNDHAATSQMHAEAVHLLEARREESRQQVRTSLEGTEWGRALAARESADEAAPRP